MREWFGGPRFGRYLTVSGGDAGRALALYECNSHLAAAALRDVGQLEVAMRNAYDAQLSARFPDWAADPASGLFRFEVARRKTGCRSGGSTLAASTNSRWLEPGWVAARRTVKCWPRWTSRFWTQLTARERYEHGVDADGRAGRPGANDACPAA